MKIRHTVALVTGAAVGSGRAIARRLAAEGAAVVLADLDTVGGDKTQQEIEGDGGRAAFRRVDVTADDDVAAAVDLAVERYGGLHILVNNAGGDGNVPLHWPKADLDHWGMVLDLNLRAAMAATQLALQPMRDAGGGAVVNISSVAGIGHQHHQYPEYAAAKAGLIRFTSASDLTAWNVRMTCVVPDWIATERAQRELADMTPEQRAAALTPIPLSTLTDTVVDLIRDDNAAGRIVELRPEESAVRGPQ